MKYLTQSLFESEAGATRPSYLIMNTLFSRTLLFLLLSVAALTACTTPPLRFMRFPAEMTETKWLLRTLEGEELELLPDTNVPFIEFDDEGAFSGHAGCNRFFGSYTVDGQALKMSDVGSTRMMCPEMETEQRFLQVLGNTDRFKLKRTLLYLFAKDSILAVFEAE